MFLFSVSTILPPSFEWLVKCRGYTAMHVPDSFAVYIWQCLEAHLTKSATCRKCGEPVCEEEVHKVKESVLSLFTVDGLLPSQEAG